MLEDHLSQWICSMISFDDVRCLNVLFFVKETATTEIYTYRHTLSLHDALPVSASGDVLRHHAPDGVSFGAMFDHHHKVDLIEGGLLASAYGAQSLDVNSVHYQGVDQLADGLAVEARAPDGLVEAYSARPNGAPLLAVQWQDRKSTRLNSSH